MLLLLVLSPLLQAQTASLLDEQLVCFMNNWIGIDEAGAQIEYDIYDSDDELSPENFFHLDLVTMEATYFWSELEDSGDGYVLGYSSDQLNIVNDRLLYAQYGDEIYTGYTSYLFEENLEHGILTEDTFVSHFSCVSSSLEHFEKSTGVSFSEYYYPQ